MIPNRVFRIPKRREKKKTIHKITTIAQLVKNPPAMQDTLVSFLGEDDPLEKGSTHCSILGLPWWLSW